MNTGKNNYVEFGDYIIEYDDYHAVIRRKDNKLPNPNWYEMFMMKCIAFGARAVAIEVYPDVIDLVDGAHQRHLWNVNKNKIPNLKTGYFPKFMKGNVYGT